jgi:hypothetical protein
MSDQTKSRPVGTIFEPMWEKSESVRRWLGMAEGKPYYLSLVAWRDQLRETLQNSKDEVEMYRTQGSLKILDRLLGLREELD